MNANHPVIALPAPATNPDDQLLARLSAEVLEEYRGYRAFEAAWLRDYPEQDPDPEWCDLFDVVERRAEAMLPATR